jgi:D-alanine-D-alanine ligase
VQGGPSTEAEVSRASAAGIAKALEEVGHRVVRLELDAFVAESLRTGGYDVVFPATHGAVGEDGSLQGLLEVASLPYVGSGVLASAVAMHKRVARVLFAAAGLPVARGICLERRACGGDAAAAAQRARSEVGVALVVKPCSHGSAIGVTRIEGSAPIEEVAYAIEQAWAIDDFAIVEVFVRGREVTCGVLDLGRPVALPPTEIFAVEDPFYNYTARYTPGRSTHICPAQLDARLLRRVQDIAVAAHEALGCRDLSRVDFIVPLPERGRNDEAGEGASVSHDLPVTLLEVNTIPGMTATSLYPEAAAVHGLSMPQLCDALARHAHARGPAERQAPRRFPAGTEWAL